MVDARGPRPQGADSGSGLHPNVRPAAGQVPRRTAGGDHQTGRPRRVPIVEWFTDEAITGDSSTSTRPGLAALLAAAKAGKFKVVLAWHTNRISREDPMDAIVFYNQLRKAGVGLHTCCEGAIDLEDFAKQLLLFINQKASNDFLIEMSAKTLRGRIANAKAGGHNGGPAVYGNGPWAVRRRWAPRPPAAARRVRQASRASRPSSALHRSSEDRRGTVRLQAV